MNPTPTPLSPQVQEWRDKALQKKTLLIHAVQRLQFGGTAEAFKAADDDLDAHLSAVPFNQAPQATHEVVQRLLFDIRGAMLRYGTAFKKDDQEGIRVTTTEACELLDRLAALAASPQPVRGEAPPYRLVIDQTRYSWPERHITGKQIRELAVVPDTFGVWQATDYSTDPRIEEDQRTDLLDCAGFSIARFFTGKLLTTQGAEPGEALPAEQPKSDKANLESASGGNDLQTALPKTGARE